VACAELLQTQAFVDGELSGAQADAAERHIAACARCKVFCEDAAALSDEIRGYARRYPAPAGLKLRVLEAVATADACGSGYATPAKETKRGIRAPAWRLRAGTLPGFFGGVAMSGLAAALIALALMPPASDLLTDRLVTAHTRALMSGRVIQVVSSDHHTVKPWFAGRIDISPPAHDFTAQGFALVGGRIDSVAGRPAAVVVYRHGLHEIDLFVWADSGERLPAMATRRGYNTLGWKERDLDFAAVSDMQASELAAFAKLIRSVPE
jgi:anti-sigma factor RsiW